MLPTSTAPERPSQTLERLAKRLRSKLRRVRKEPADVDAVHDARVAARRLLATGELYAYAVSEWNPLRTRIPKIVRRLGRVRNLDVAMEFLRRGPASDRKIRGELSEVFKRRRRKERERVQEWLGDGRIRRVQEPLGRLLQEVRRHHVTEVVGPEDLMPLFSRILSLYSDRAWSTDPEAAHDVRREVRRLRYAHETLAWAYSERDFRRAHKALRKVQELAGSWHDRCVVEELAEKAVRKGRVTVSIGRFRGRLHRESRALIREFVAATTELIELRSVIVGAFR